MATECCLSGAVFNNETARRMKVVLGSLSLTEKGILQLVLFYDKKKKIQKLPDHLGICLCKKLD
jgi:hypothetical protein